MTSWLRGLQRLSDPFGLGRGFEQDPLRLLRSAPGQVVAVVVPRLGAEVTADALMAHFRGQLAPYKVPRRVRFVPMLPRGPSGKLLRRVIRDQLAVSSGA